MVTPRKTGRLRKARTVWEQAGAPSTAKDPKIPQKAARTAKNTALKPIALSPFPEDIRLNEDHLPELPNYTPPFNLHFQPSKSLVHDLSELEIFDSFCWTKRTAAIK